MSCVGDEMCNLGAEVFPDGPSHVMNQIHQVFLNMKKKKKKNTYRAQVQDKEGNSGNINNPDGTVFFAQTLHQALINHHFEKLYFIMAKFGN